MERAIEQADEKRDSWIFGCFITQCTVFADHGASMMKHVLIVELKKAEINMKRPMTSFTLSVCVTTLRRKEISDGRFAASPIDASMK